MADNIYDTFQPNLYKINSTSPASGDPSLDTQTTPESISGGQLTSTLDVVQNAIKGGKDKFDNTQTGFIIGVDKGVYKFYIGSPTNYLNFDGSSVSIVPSLSVSFLDIPDKVTANSFHVDSSGNTWWGATTLGASIASVTKAGVCSFVSGTIGGFTLSSTTITATNLTLTSGAANTANITVGTGANAGGINSANTGTDIIFWGGAAFANRATAPFQVSAAGSVTATSITNIGNTSTTFLSFDGNILKVMGDVNLPLCSGVQGTEPTGYKNNTGAAGTLTSKLGKMTLALTGAAAGGEVGIESDVGLMDMSANAIFAIDFKFNQFTFTGSAVDSTMQYLFIVGQQNTNLRSCFGLRAKATGSGAQTLSFSVVNYDSVGTLTSTTISPTVNVTNKLLVVYQAGVQIQFFLNGSLVATSTTNLPATNATTSEIIYIDGQVQNSNVTSPPTVTISRFHVTGTGLG